MRVLRILFKVVLALVAIVVLAGVVVYVLAGRRIDRTYQVSTPPVEVPADAEAIARGKRLVTVVAPCNDCHADDFGGKVMIDGLAMGTLHAANLTRGRGGIGATYSDEDWVRVLLHGVRTRNVAEGLQTALPRRLDQQIAGAEEALEERLAGRQVVQGSRSVRI